MKPSMKMGLIVAIGVCVIFYQYHLSSGVRFDQVTEFSGAETQLTFNQPNSQPNEHPDEYVSQKITKETVKLAVKTVQKTVGLSPEVSEILVQELTDRFNKVLTKGGNAVPTEEKKKTELPRLYVVTPTYKRPEQIADLTRVAQTLMHIENLHWLVVEDATTRTPMVEALLKRSGLIYEHMIAPMADKYKKKKGPKPRGVAGRLRGIAWIRANATKGVLYFADDDNSYDIDLFSEIRKTRRVSMFPVGLVTQLGVSTPIVKNGKFAGFYDGWMAGRKFPVDMAGFAVNVEFLLKRPNATMPYRAGFEESGFLESLAPLEPSEVELLAGNCTRILVWHTQTKKNSPSAPLNTKSHNSTNLVLLKRQLV